MRGSHGGLLRNLAEDRSLDSILTGGRGGFLLLKASSCASMAVQSIEALVSLLTRMCGGMVMVTAVMIVMMTHCRLILQQELQLFIVRVKW